MLGLLALAVIPIVLHLITLHRLKVTELSTFRFLFDSYMRKRSRLKFMEALLTALRALFILLLVLAICRPVVKRWSAAFGHGGRGPTVMLIDCSASMNARTDGVSALERAKAAAVAVCAHLGEEERLTVLRVTSQTEEVLSGLSPDQDAIRERIEALEPSPASGRMVPAIRRAFELCGKQGALATLYVFTDCQASGWRQAREQGLDQIVPAGARIVVVDVGSRGEIPNCAVVGDEPSGQRAIVGLPVILRARAINASKTETRELAVRAFIDEQEVNRTMLTLKPGEERVSTFAFVPRQAGVLRGRFEIAADRFPDDDTFVFALPVMPPVRVVLVNGNPNADPFEDEGLYLRVALTAGASDTASADRSTWNAAANDYKDIVRSLDVREIPEASVKPDTLRTAGLVILANCGCLSAQQFVWLQQYVADGGGLLLFPGDLVRPEDYNEQFFPVIGLRSGAVSPVRLSAPVGDPKDAGTFEHFAAVDYHHPIFTVFDDPQSKYLAGVRFYRRFPLSAAAEDAPYGALARFFSGEPALVESRLGKGTVLLAAFPLNAKWSNLPVRPEFVPLVLRMVNYAQRRPDVQVPARATEGGAEIAVGADWVPVSGRVRDEKGTDTLLEFKRADVRMVAVFDQAKSKGYYTAELQGGVGDSAKSGSVVIAVNTAPDESGFSRVGEQELREIMPRARVAVVDASAEAQQAHGAVGDEREIWRPLIWLLFLIMGVEFALATMAGDARRPREGWAWLDRVVGLMPARWRD